MSDSNSNEMIEAFRDDAFETLSRWESVCLSAKSETAENTYKALMRCAHNLKGNSALIGFQDLADVIHRLEDRLLELEKIGAQPTEPTLLALFFEAERYLRYWVTELVKNQNFKNTDFEVLSALEDYQTKLKSGGEVSSSNHGNNSEHDEASGAATDDGSSETANEGSRKSKKNVVALDTSAVQEIHEQVRISSHKLDVLIQNVGELTLAQAIVNRGRVENRLGAPEVREAILLCEKITQRLRATVLDLRMLPMIGLYKKLERASLEVSARLQKPVQFLTSGHDVTVDKAVLNRIFDPLLHLVRNAVDHGIEPVADRVKAGKPEFGTLNLTAEVAASGIVIRLKDDGRGLDVEKIRSRAVERGLIGADQKLSEADIISYIFMPNFSTAAEVTEVSGRGVGLDIVLKEIHALGGTLLTESKSGQGTEFIISLPVNVSLIDVMVLNAGGIIYAVPTQDIGEVVQIRDVQFQGSALHENMMLHQGGVVPLDALEACMMPPALGGGTVRYPLDIRSKTDGCVLIVNARNQNFGFFVDEVMGQQQIFSRPAKGYLGQLAGITASTILSTGDPALIINIKEIASHHFNKQHRGHNLGDHHI